jgi:hypothetical protein
MTLLVITGKGGETTPDTARRDVARAQQLARRIDDLVVLEADETWWTPVRARRAEMSGGPEPVEPDADARRSSLAPALQQMAERDAETVVLLLDADLEVVKRIHPVTQRLGLPLLWWREEPPTEAIVADVRSCVAGLLTSWSVRDAVPSWLWSVGAGIDLRDIELIETFPTRPPLRLLVWATTGADPHGVLRTVALARGLNADVHLTIAMSGDVAHEARHLIEAEARNLALTRSVDIAMVDGPRPFARMLAHAHALVDVEGPGDTLALEPLVAMAHGRPVLSARPQLAKLLEAAPLPLRFSAGDERQLAERMKSLAAAWSEELDTTGQLLRDAARDEHSVVHWAEAVDSIVGFVRRHAKMADQPTPWEPPPASSASVTNGSGGSTASTQPAEPDRPEETLDRDGNSDGGGEAAGEASSADITDAGSRRRRRRAQRRGER